MKGIVLFSLMLFLSVSQVIAGSIVKDISPLLKGSVEEKSLVKADFNKDGIQDLVGWTNQPGQSPFHRHLWLPTPGWLVPLGC